MRSIDDIIADARQMAAGSLHEAFALGGTERALELKARFETTSLEPSPASAPACRTRADSAAVGQDEDAHEPRWPLRPERRAVLLRVIALLTLALWHARAARFLPALALLICLAALLRDWTEESPHG